MIWSLTKILAFFAIVCALPIGSIQLIGLAGGLQITVAGVEYTLTAFQSVIALGLLMGFSWVFFKLIGCLGGFLLVIGFWGGFLMLIG